MDPQVSIIIIAVITVFAILCMIIKLAKIREECLRHERAEIEADWPGADRLAEQRRPGSGGQQTQVESSRSADPPPNYDEPPSYQSIQILQESFNENCPTARDREPTPTNRTIPNIMDSEPPEYDSLFTISQLVDQNAASSVTDLDVKLAEVEVELKNM